MNPCRYWLDHKDEIAAVPRYVPYKMPYGSSSWEWKIKTAHGIETRKTKRDAYEYAERAEECEA
jgi:hypothetical protein